MHKARENGTATQTWPCTYISDTVSASTIWEKKCECLVLCSTVNRILFHKAFWAWQNQQPFPAWWNICPFQLLHTPVFFVHQRLYSAVLLLYFVSLYWVCVARFWRGRATGVASVRRFWKLSSPPPSPQQLKILANVTWNG